jgi:hypothetical protein
MMNEKDKDKDIANNMSKIYCPKCGGPAEEIIYAEKNIRKGWYCKPCKFFIKAIFRERVVEPL